MVIKRVSPLSVAKIAGLLYAVIGLFIGGMISLAMLIARGAATATGDREAQFGFLAPIFGISAIVIMPILYGCIGAVFALIGAAIYNVAAGWVGGVEVDVQ